MEFQHPEYLLLFLALPFLAYWFYRRRAWMLSVLENFGGEAQFSSLMKGFSEKKQTRQMALVLTALTLLVFGTANLRLPDNKQVEKVSGIPVVLVLDVSNSMLAKDIAPNRLERSKAFFNDLINDLRGHQIGLITFAGIADVTLPPNNDYVFLKNKLRSIGTESIAVQGTAVGAALRAATTTLNGKSGIVLMATDVEDHAADAEAAAKRLKENGGYLVAFGVGTQQGGPVPNGLSGFKKAQNGETVHSKLNVELLQAIGQAAGGSIADLSDYEAAIKLVQTKIGQIERGEVELVDGLSYRSLFQWFLLPAFFLLVFELALRER